MIILAKSRNTKLGGLHTCFKDSQGAFSWRIHFLVLQLYFCRYWVGWLVGSSIKELIIFKTRLDDLGFSILKKESGGCGLQGKKENVKRCFVVFIDKLGDKRFQFCDFFKFEHDLPFPCFVHNFFCGKQYVFLQLNESLGLIRGYKVIPISFQMSRAQPASKISR